MPRVVKEYDERYNEFLDVAQRLFYQKGYEQTSVQEIIQEMGVAKGLFYYYFSSKTDLLDAIIHRMMLQGIAVLQPLVEDTTMDALTKLSRFFDRTQSWKLANKALMLELTRVMYRDDNILLRTKFSATATPYIVPLLAAIVRQGVEERVFNVEHPDESAEILIELSQAMASAVANFLLNPRPEEAEFCVWMAGIKRRVRSYERSIERILGAASNSICLITDDQLHEWFTE
ncbi:MAG: hypothetical protein BroJett021_49480 [Chloroflexota bacterium]|nr:TetR/AcrR family transcriptional regulator [Caldilinea sp.]GIK75960.1 MAG: hypothetical protein BroJett021_49480 [Chloroflexota bacterium]